jgi:hypothetical protein
MTEQATAEITTTEVVKPAKAAKADKKVKLVKQKVTLISADPMTLVAKLEEYILAGARVDPKEFAYLRTLPMRVGLYVEGPADKDDWLWKNDPYLNCFGIDVAEFTYDAAALEALEWADFRKVCAGVGVKGKERARMTKDYLAAIE